MEDPVGANANPKIHTLQDSKHFFAEKNYLEQDAEEKARAAEEGEGNDEAWVLQQTVVGSYRYERNYPKGISSCLAWGLKTIATNFTYLYTWPPNG